MIQLEMRSSEKITRELLTEIGDFQAGPCVSVYTPVVTAGPQTRQNDIRFSNQVKQAASLFERYGMSRRTAEEAVEPLEYVRERMEAPDAVRYPGVATFLSPERRFSVFVPSTVSERVIIGPRFVTRHLLPFVDVPTSVFVLALSRGEAKLYEMTRGDERKLKVNGLPGSFAEFTALEDPEKSVQHHGKAESSVFHGHGASKDAGEQLEEDYVRRVAEAVEAHIAGSDMPLLLAATDKMAAEFRRLTSGPGRVAQVVPGNAERMSPAQLRDSVWPVVDRYVTSLDMDTEARFRELLTSEQDDVITDVRQAIEMAYQGRITELLFPEKFEASGWFDRDTGIVTIDAPDEVDPGADDLVDLAAVLSLQHGGEARLLRQPPERDNGNERPLNGIVAVLRI